MSLSIMVECLILFWRICALVHIHLRVFGAGLVFGGVWILMSTLHSEIGSQAYNRLMVVSWMETGEQVVCLYCVIEEQIV